MAHPLKPDVVVRSALLFVLVLAACHPPGYGKADVPAPEIDAAPATADSPTGDSPPAATCTKSFRLDGHGTAHTVWLSGSFVMWAVDPAHGAIELALGVDGAWTATYDFDAGQHQYKYIVDDNQWILDPTNPDQIDDGMGNTNSVFTCVP